MTNCKFTIKELLTLKTGEWNSGAVAINMAAIGSFINEVPSYTNLYDKYKICSYAVTVVPRADAMTIDSATFTADRNFIFISALDYDDALNVDSEQGMFNFRNHKWTRGTQVHKRYIKYPHILQWVQETGTGTGANAVSVKSKWLDAAQLNVPHYGYKWGCKPGGPTGGFLYADIIIDVYCKWAGRR